MRQPRGKAAHLDEIKRLFSLDQPLAFANPLHAQGVLNILHDGHMREQRIALEDRANIPLVGRDVRDIFTGHHHTATIRRFETGNRSKDCGLSRSARAEDGEEFSGGDIEGNAIEGRFAKPAIGLVDSIEERMLSYAGWGIVITPSFQADLESTGLEVVPYLQPAVEVFRSLEDHHLFPEALRLPNPARWSSSANHP